MANTHATLTALFTDIADAIRTKTGKSETIVADNFPDKIRAITVGGGGSTSFETCAVTLSSDDDSDLVPKRAAYMSVKNGKIIATSELVSRETVITCLKGSILAVEYNKRISNDIESFSNYEKLFSASPVSVYKLKDDATTAEIYNTDMGVLA